MTIKFGTDGWRGKIGEEFTDSNLRIVTQATADYLKDKEGSGKLVVIGYDSRFRSEEYASIVAEIFSSNGFEVLLSDSPVSTPVVSFVTNRFKAALGVCITASHNPPYYNGYKIKESFGGSALTSTINNVTPYLGKNRENLGNKKNITKLDLTTEYFQHLRSIFDLTRISSFFQSFPIHLEYMNGSAAGYVGEVFKELYVPTLEYSLNRDPLFGGVNPEPIPANLKGFISGVRAGVGFAFDGDGDRICAVSHTGRYVSSSQLLALLMRHMKKRHNANRVVCTVSCSTTVHKMATSLDLNLEVVPVGFKHIADKMLAPPTVLIGGEESGGIGFAGYLPERDGIANCLLTLEMLAHSSKSLETLVEDMELDFGQSYQDRIDLHLEDPVKAKTFRANLRENPEAFFSNVKSIVTIDGIKVNLSNNSWIMFRQSGTEPLMRIYAESDNEVLTKKLLATGKAFLL